VPAALTRLTLPRGALEFVAGAGALAAAAA